jgi:hypothetical protein
VGTARKVCGICGACKAEEGERMKFKISCAEHWDTSGFVKKYKDILKEFDLEIEPYDDDYGYDASAWITINSLEELFKLGETVNEQLVFDTKRMEITIYDYWLE